MQTDSVNLTYPQGFRTDPKLPNNELNLQFLTALEDIGFISSKREEKDGEYLRVYHKSQKNN